MATKSKSQGKAKHGSSEVRPLSFIQPKETKRSKRAKSGHYTKWVKKLRITLPACALVVMGIVLLWPMIRTDALVGVIVKNAPDLVIQNLHFTGLDSKSQPYSISAAKATRPSGLTNIYDLEKPEGEMTMTNGTWLAGKAQYGRYDQAGRKLWLGGDVQLFHDKGYQFTTDEAQVDMNENNAWGEKPVLIQGSFGEIRGIGFRLLDSGSVMIVKGPATAALSLHSDPASDKPAGTQK